MAIPFSGTRISYLFFCFSASPVFRQLAHGEQEGKLRGDKRRPSPTSWGRRHITLMVSVNISLTPVPLLAEHLPSLSFPPAANRNSPRPPLPPAPPGAAPWGPVCFPARGTGGGTLMRCSGHREMRHNLPAPGLGEIAVFTF